jgi:hypothetical protein
MAVSDTSPEIQALDRKIQRSMSGEQHLLEALEMSLFARELAKAKVRHDHPDWTEAGIAREVLRLEFLPDPLPCGLR